MQSMKYKIARCAVSVGLVAIGTLPMAVSAFDTKALNNINTFGGDRIKSGVVSDNITDIPALAGVIINFALGFLGIIAVILVLIAGFQWMTADSEDKVKEARKRLVNSVAGLVIVALAWVIGWAVINSIAKITTS